MSGRDCPRCGFGVDTDGDCGICPRMSDALAQNFREFKARGGAPSKAERLARLTEAAEAIGWGVSTGGTSILRPADSLRPCGEVYISEGFVCTVNGPVDTPVELMALLLEASQ